MKMIRILLFIMSFVILPSIGYGQSTKEAYLALKKIEAKVSVGISQKDYKAALGDAQFAVNLFLESPDAKKKLKLSESLSMAMRHYLYAGIVWEHKFAARSDYIHFRGSDKEFWEAILKGYPDANEIILADKVGEAGGLIDTREIIGFFWKKASRELENATTIGLND